MNKKIFAKMLGRKNYIRIREIKQKCVKAGEYFKNIKRYKTDLRKYCEMNKRTNFQYDKNYEHRILGEWEENAGTLGTYFWQDLWAARHIKEKAPVWHYDIGSSVAGFIGHLCSFRDNIVLIDVRPLETKISGVTFLQGDAKNLSEIPSNSIESLSSLCALEHFGLGRYGDEIDPEGCFKALSEMQRVLRPGGILYLSVPVGCERLQFNAHRIFYPSTIVNELSDMKLLEFATTGFVGDEISYCDDINKYDKLETGGGYVRPVYV